MGVPYLLYSCQYMCHFSMYFSRKTVQHAGGADRDGCPRQGKTAEEWHRRYAYILSHGNYAYMTIGQTSGPLGKRPCKKNTLCSPDKNDTRDNASAASIQNVSEPRPPTCNSPPLALPCPALPCLYPLQTSNNKLLTNLSPSAFGK